MGRHRGSRRDMGADDFRTGHAGVRRLGHVEAAGMRMVTIYGPDGKPHLFPAHKTMRELLGEPWARGCRVVFDLWTGWRLVRVH